LQVLATAAPFNWKDALSAVSQTADALDHAHGAGVVHRDVKPSNIMLQRGRTVKITDFGIAKITTTQQLTRTGMTMGTPSYMSPEQIQAEPLDGRADQFSLAVVAFQILTGAKPFQGDSLPTLVHEIVYKDRPSARAANQNLPVAVDEVLHRGLAKRPEDRYGSCTEFALALESALTEAPRLGVFGSEPDALHEKQQSEFTALFGDFIEARRLEVERKERADQLDRIVQESERYLASGDRRGALDALDAGREKFGHERAFLDVSERLREAQQEAERQRRIDEAVQQAREKLKERAFAATLSMLDAADAEYGNPATIAELRALVLEEQAADKRDSERRVYTADLGKTLAHAKELMALPSPAEAVTFLESATGRFGKESEFTRLFASAIHAKRAAEDRAAKLDEVVNCVEASLARGDLHSAQVALESGKRDFPGATVLAPLLSRLDELHRAAGQETPAYSNPEFAPPQTMKEETVGHVHSTVPVSLWMPPSAEAQTTFLQAGSLRRRAMIPRSLLIGSGTAAFLILGLLLLKIVVFSLRNGQTHTAHSAKQTGDATVPSIRMFGAAPASIRIGESATLSWSVENATEVVIDQDIGKVAASGSLIVSPIARTHYRLTARGPGGATDETAFVNVVAQRSPPLAAPEVTTTARRPASAPIDKPLGPLTTESAEDSEWRSLEAGHDVSALEAFLLKYPNGVHREDATHRAEQLDWDALPIRGDANAVISALRSFIQKYPNSPHKGSATGRINAMAAALAAASSAPTLPVENNVSDGAKVAMEKTIANLISVRGDLGVQSGLIATNGKELQALKQLGQRDYVDVKLAKVKGNVPQTFGDVQLILEATDPKHNTFTVIIIADDKRVEKRNRTLNAPIQFLLSKSLLPYELVINDIKKDLIAGYLSVPKPR